MSRLLKFKPVLSMSESIEYLESSCGEKVSAEFLVEISRHGHLNPILGYGSFLIGFDRDGFERLLGEGQAEACAYTYLGVPRSYAFGMDDKLLIHTTAKCGKDLFFTKPPPSGRKDHELIQSPLAMDDLGGLHPDDLNEFNFPTEQIHNLACGASSESMPSTKTGPSTIEVEWIDGVGATISIEGPFQTIRKINSRLISRTAVPKNPAVEPPSYRLAIFVLLEMLRRPQRPVMNQGRIISEILDSYPNQYGLSKSNLEKIFSDAKKAGKDSALP